MKNNTYLFISILALLGGLCLLLFYKADVFSIGLILMGAIGTLAGMFLLMNPEQKKNDKKSPASQTESTQKSPTSGEHICDHSHCVASVPVRPKLIDNKAVCKYCKCKFAKNLDKCPYCGAPQNS